MTMLKKFYLVFMGLTYFAIGAWAIIDPGFTDAIGLQVTSDIGYSEIAGIYGGLNLCIGFMCVVGIFKENIATFSIKFITFLVGSIALGRVLFSMMPSTPSFYNEYFAFEVCAFIAGIFLLYQQKQLD